MTNTEQQLFFVTPNAAVPEAASASTMGSKAYGLLRLARLGLPVPPAFVLGTSVCRDYLSRGSLCEDTRALIVSGVSRLQELTGRQFGGQRRPLLVAVRSGAPISMPGMMDTILNIGLCERNLHGFLRANGNPRQVRDCYRRLVRDFMVVVHGASASTFEAIVERSCSRQGLASARELDSASLAQIADESIETAHAAVGLSFPQDPMQQLLEAVEAVFRSWTSDKAQRYRRMKQIDDSMGTAVTVQSMVFGNGGSDSGAGVGFTRDPASGEDRMYLDFLFNAQGEDVVSGRHTAGDAALIVRRLPGVSAGLQRVRAALEAEFRDMQDFEFTVENGQLYLLQTRTGQRTPWAALRIAVEMVRAGQITPKEGLTHLEGLKLDRIERLRLNVEDKPTPLAVAVSAGIGVASGVVVFDATRAAERAAKGQSVILVRSDIRTEDIEGIAAAAGILTAAGGRTSHAAVVARQLGKVCLVGCTALHIALNGGGGVIGETHLSEGDELTLDGDSGLVYAGRLSVVREKPERELSEVAAWRGVAL